MGRADTRIKIVSALLARPGVTLMGMLAAIRIFRLVQQVEFFHLTGRIWPRIAPSGNSSPALVMAVTLTNHLPASK